jgi:hypothetical protein
MNVEEIGDEQTYFAFSTSRGAIRSTGDFRSLQNVQFYLSQCRNRGVGLDAMHQ